MPFTFLNGDSTAPSICEPLGAHRSRHIPELILELEYSLPPLQPAASALEELPDAGHKSHRNLLKVFPEPTRRLENMYPIGRDLDKALVAWLELVSLAPSTSDRVEMPGRFPDRVPAKEENPMFSRWADEMEKPKSIYNLKPWLEMPLQVAQHAFKILFPASKDYCFLDLDIIDERLDKAGSKDKDLVQFMSWSTPNRNSKGVPNLGRLIVACQPPWILSNKDISEFARCKSFPPYLKAGHIFPEKYLESQHRVWAKLWDTCVMNNSRYFVLTNYNCWVFGVFSEGWGNASVSNVYTHDSLWPSITQLLLFWIASAMRNGGTFKGHDIPEPTGNRFTRPKVLLTMKEASKVPESESHWDGKSEEAASSAGVALTDIIDTVSTVNGEPGPGAHSTRYDAVLRVPAVQRWVQDSAVHASDPDSPEVLPIRPRVRRVIDHCGDHTGDWLV